MWRAQNSKPPPVASNNIAAPSTPAGAGFLLQQGAVARGVDPLTGLRVAYCALSADRELTRQLLQNRTDPPPDAG